jgi:hypothetical protein
MGITVETREFRQRDKGMNFDLDSTDSGSLREKELLFVNHGTKHLGNYGGGGSCEKMKLRQNRFSGKKTIMQVGPGWKWGKKLTKSCNFEFFLWATGGICLVNSHNANT